MKRTKEQPIQEAIQLFLRDSGLETPLLQYRLIQAWPSVVGRTVATKTHAEKISGQVLWVKVDSPSLRIQLQMAKQQLVMKLNQVVNCQLIYDLRCY